ncbi:MAG: hypothetical protein IKI31_04720 [Treponema sp.]|nr:hypothetical protein [Treponema sp.]
MKWFTHEELIDEIMAHLKIKSIGDGKWNVLSHIDKQNGNIELSMITPKQTERGKLREQRNKQFAKDLLKELIHKNWKYVWDPGDIKGLIYYASGKYCLLETDIEQRVFDSQPRGYWIWKTPVGFAHGDYPDFCKNLKEFEEAVKTAPADLKTVREKTIDKAVEIVAELNRGDKAIRLNDIVFPQKGYECSIQNGFLARAKELIFNATREQLESAYDEYMEASDDYTPGSYIFEVMLKQIGNKAPNPENEKTIDYIQFTDIRR